MPPSLRCFVKAFSLFHTIEYAHQLASMFTRVRKLVPPTKNVLKAFTLSKVLHYSLERIASRTFVIKKR